MTATRGQQKGKIGLAVADLNGQMRQQFNVPENVHGVVVQQVRPASPAEDAGLQPGDVILEVNRKPAESASDFVNEVHNLRPGRMCCCWCGRRGTPATARCIRRRASRTDKHELDSPMDYPDCPWDDARPSGRRPGIFFGSKKRIVRATWIGARTS